VTNSVSTTTVEAWLHPFAEDAPPPPLSDRLIRALEAQAAATAADIDSCRRLASRSRDPVVATLVAMIVDDEQRHDALMRSMIRSLQEEVDFVSAVDAEPLQGDPAPATQEQSSEIATSVRGLIRNEHESARHLRHLGRQEPTLRDGLYPLLLETIARDAEKHATILLYLLRRIEERAQ
jgi:rubrerythrin